VSRRAVSGRLVFIPGFLDDATLWRGVIERLALPGWESVPVNLRGTGRAEPRRGATLEAYRDQVLEALDELERTSARPVIVVGHSMGAQVAELVAGCRPHVEQPAAVAAILTRFVIRITHDEMEAKR
jgi:pimeloyl-ACP methyl ester carboxylesterase